MDVENADCPEGMTNAEWIEVLRKSQNAPWSERVAEGFWQKANNTGHDIPAHKAWLVLPDAEKEPWRRQGEAAVAKWLQDKGYDPSLAQIRV